MKIVIEIECGERHCEKCHFQDADYLLEHRVHHCGYFHKNLLSSDGKTFRCSECLAAEARIALLEEIEKEQTDEPDCNSCPLCDWEECDEICQSKKTLIEKIAELAEENESNKDAVDLAKEGMGQLLANLKDIVEKAGGEK